MSETIHKALVALQDVHGIEGSFLLNPEGALVAMEMPSLYDAALFKDVGPRIERLAESFSSFGDEFESCVIRFSDHLLCVKQFAKGGALCILTNSTVNLPALKMAMNLTHRRLAPEMADATPLAASPPVAATAAAAAPNGGVPPPNGHPVAIPERRTQRFYRGHLVEE